MVPPEIFDNQAIPLESSAIVAVRGALIRWYQANCRQLPWRESKNPYHIWVSEVMLQQTQVKTVLPYYQRFLRQFPDLESLAAARQSEVLKIWEGLGYYARARNLHRAAQMVIDTMKGTIPGSLEAFKKLPGVGDYIAAAVQSIAFNGPHAVVDGNVKRVLARMFMLSAPVNAASYHKQFRILAQSLLDRDDPATFNQAIMELGALVCRPKTPSCHSCPLAFACRALMSQQTLHYPLRVKTRPIPQYRIAVGVVGRGKYVLITRRKPEGLLGGLWEFPGGKLKDGESAEAACLREIHEEVDLDVEIIIGVARIRHAYTHFKIIMDVFLCRYLSGKVALNGPVDYRWIELQEIERFALPKATHKFLPQLKKIVASSPKMHGSK